MTTASLFDEVFRHESIPEKRRDSSLWHGVGDLQKHGKDGRGIDNVWATFNSGMDRGALMPPTQESPMKKRKTRAPNTDGRRRTRKERRKRVEPEGISTNNMQFALTTTTSTFDLGEYDDSPLALGSDPCSEEGREEGRMAEDDKLGEYMELFQAGSVGFILVGTYLYVVQGWDKRKREPTVRIMTTLEKMEYLQSEQDKWYHFEAKRVGDEETYLEFREEEFRALEERVFVFWFWRVLEVNTPDEGMRWINWFSVGLGQERNAAVNTRVIVSFLGSDSGSGVWACSECSGMKCVHRSAARGLFGRVMGIEDLSDNLETLTLDLDKEEKEDDVVMFADGHGGRLEDVSISYLPIRPPIWAELPDDHPHYPRPSSREEHPSRTPLLAKNHSLCGREECTIASDLKLVKKCTIYDVNKAHTADIELSPCSLCPARKHCFIGPETRDAGLFNYNNSVLFTHDLLDEYTSQFTTSETPFVAFVETTKRWYERSGSRFVKEDLFQSTWFAYVKIQDFSNDMFCKWCGKEPDCLIWDGVTLGFGRKHLTDSLRPPMYTDDRSPQRRGKYAIKPQLLADQQKLRRLIRGWVKRGNKTSEKSTRERTDGENREADALDVLGEFWNIVGQLNGLSCELALLFNNNLSPTTVISPRLRQAYVVFFEQIAAEESALQMISVKSLPLLGDFVQQPTWEMGSKLVDIPALYNVLEVEFQVNGRYPTEMTKVVQWLCERTNAVWIDTCSRDSGLGDDEVMDDSCESKSWMQTGCCYSLPQLRRRPVYKSLRKDGGVDNAQDGERGGKCAKYCSTYGDKRLTGGIMAVWCTHSICYGFHCITKGEGRNDVFSAMYTRWKRAPRCVIYDFACALGPYCMSREPHFFKDMQFMIDKFHAPGHSKCSSACFLANYVTTDPSLVKVNSSAAECGNSGIGRIRKSVSYMRQDRAILYTKVFLSVWNRGQLRK
ncbi:hypothetical protein PM082_015514 [Marasmius tenuissimus]|nr:hypothetical protein PM082_015514 [Marasmius tenuissimus]